MKSHHNRNGAHCVTHARAKLSYDSSGQSRDDSEHSCRYGDTKHKRHGVSERLRLFLC